MSTDSFRISVEICVNPWVGMLLLCSAKDNIAIYDIFPVRIRGAIEENSTH